MRKCRLALERLGSRKHVTLTQHQSRWSPTEICMTRGVDCIQHMAAPLHGGVLRRNGDTTLLLENVAVHKAVCARLDTASPQQLVHEGGLAMVDVRCSAFEAE